MKKLLLVLGLITLITGSLYAGQTVTYPYTLANGQTADGSKTQADLDEVGNKLTTHANATSGEHGITGTIASTADIANRVLKTQSRVLSVAGDFLTASTSFVDVSTMTITMTTGANRVKIGCIATGVNDTGGKDIALDVTIDGTAQGGTYGLQRVSAPTANYNCNLSFVYLSDTLSSASHTFKLQFRVESNNGKLRASTDVPLIFWVEEIN
jgi:hypothetical protein